MSISTPIFSLIELIYKLENRIKELEDRVDILENGCDHEWEDEYEWNGEDEIRVSCCQKCGETC